MAQHRRITVTLSGTGTADYISAEVLPEGRSESGLLLGIDIRLDVTANNASAIIPFAVCNGDDLADLPAQEVISFTSTSITLTGHATTASLSTMFDNPSDFTNGLTVGGQITATGAWTLYITAHIELRDK